MADVVDRLAQLSGFRYVGVDPESFEPMFREGNAAPIPFDLLPNRARHLIAFVALTARSLWGAYPGRDPRDCQGVVCIDEVDLQQDERVCEGLIPALSLALPEVQWIVSATSPTVGCACPAGSVLALRKIQEVGQVVLFQGSEALTH
jgi:predicted ATP-binding protein involved in virulence